MDTFRYVLAVALICMFPPILLYWPAIHAFIRFWRRLGPMLTNVMVLGPAALFGVFLYWFRASLLVVEFGTNWLLIALGALCTAAAVWLRVLLSRDVTNKLLSGLPELEPERNPQQLVRTGVYAHLRHPRYLQMSLSLLGYALVANYLASYILLFVWLPAIYFIVLLEERELRERFGEEYERYSIEAPRFLPKIGS